jgi:hypothetical protein
LIGPYLSFELSSDPSGGDECASGLLLKFSPVVPRLNRPFVITHLLPFPTSDLKCTDSREMSDGSLSAMKFASFTNLPALTKFPAHSADGGRTVSASVGVRRSIALLVTAAAEFVAIAVSAHFAAAAYRRLIRLYSPEPAKSLSSQNGAL